MSLITQLQKYSADLPNKTKRVLERMIEEGKNIAEFNLSTAEYTGSLKSEITTNISKNKGEVSLDGHDARFIEFGTGITYYGGEDSHPLAGRGDLTPSERGTYKHKRGMLPTWTYQDIGGTGTSPKYSTWEVLDKNGNPTGIYRTHGQPANRVVYNTGKELERIYVDVAKEVFGND